MKNKVYEYKMTIDGREIGGSVVGPQSDTAAVVAHLQGIYPKATNVTATEIAPAAPVAAGQAKPPAPAIAPPKPAEKPAVPAADAKPQS